MVAYMKKVANPYVRMVLLIVAGVMTLGTGLAYPKVPIAASILLMGFSVLAGLLTLKLIIQYRETFSHESQVLYCTCVLAFIGMPGAFINTHIEFLFLAYVFISIAGFLWVIGKAFFVDKVFASP